MLYESFNFAGVLSIIGLNPLLGLASVFLDEASKLLG